MVIIIVAVLGILILLRFILIKRPQAITTTTTNNNNIKQTQPKKPRVTISTSMILTKSENGDFSISNEVVEAITKISSKCDIFLITRVDTDSEEQLAHKALQDSGIFQNGLVNELKAIYCSKEEGRISIVRQIEPHLHVDGSEDIVKALQPYTKKICFISEQSQFPPGKNVSSFPNLKIFSDSSLFA
eukprot:c19988_g1_i1.p1 GENE.c19988_g1_i1~~c19988_g1_i1.p1  ORF type:complete len:196 (+),score=71.15 c19988_g1_i1:29-589(+)